MNGRVHFGCLLFMIIFSAHRKQIRDFVTYATSFLFIALHFGFAGRLLAQSIDDGAPVITSQPQWYCRPLGGPGAANAYFNVSANGRLPLKYQWYRGGDAILNATNSYYQGSLGSGDNVWGPYSVVVSNGSGVARSTEAWVGATVFGKVNLVSGLQDQSVYEGDRIHLSVSVCDGGGTSGSSFGWTKNGVATLGGFDLIDINKYNCNIHQVPFTALADERI